MPVFNGARELTIPVWPLVLSKESSFLLFTFGLSYHPSHLWLIALWKELLQHVVLVRVIDPLQLLQVGLAQLHRGLQVWPLPACLLVLHSVNESISFGTRKRLSVPTWICRVASQSLHWGVSLEQNSTGEASGSRWCFEEPSSPLPKQTCQLDLRHFSFVLFCFCFFLCLSRCPILLT